MTEYHVLWEIDLEADSREDAARKALSIHRNPDSIATCFIVDGHHVDLLAPAIKVTVRTADGLHHKTGTPFAMAIWLVETYGEHADAQGISGPTHLVDETYTNIALLLEGPRRIPT